MNGTTETDLTVLWKWQHGFGIQWSVRRFIYCRNQGRITMCRLIMMAVKRFGRNL